MLLVAFFLLTAATVYADSTTMRWSTVHITTADGVRHSFRVEVPQTATDRRRGLMFRRHLPDGEGMLFLFEPPRPVSMWMKNTFIPLTMLFVAPDGRVVRVVDSTEPLSEESIHSGQPVSAVLELAGGTASRLSLRSGDQLNLEP